MLIPEQKSFGQASGFTPRSHLPVSNTACDLYWTLVMRQERHVIHLLPPETLASNPTVRDVLKPTSWENSLLRHILGIVLYTEVPCEHVPGKPKSKRHKGDAADCLGDSETSSPTSACTERTYHCTNSRAWTVNMLLIV